MAWRKRLICMRNGQWHFNFKDSMVNEYLSEGYLIFRGIVPPSLLSDLRREAEKARDLGT